jgi:hypothetical protein
MNAEPIERLASIVSVGPISMVWTVGSHGRGIRHDTRFNRWVYTGDKHKVKAATQHGRGDFQWKHNNTTTAKQHNNTKTSE